MDKNAPVASANKALQKAKLNLAEAQKTWGAKNEALTKAQHDLSDLRNAEAKARTAFESATSELNEAKKSSEELERKLAKLRAELQAMRMLSEATDPSGVRKNNSNNKPDSQQPKAKQLANTGTDITLLPVGAGITLLGISLLGTRKRRTE
ncbi:LPXTG cell wall anchor domain-containing protein [Actinotignum urinale]|uniref:LPXTG cell wall anchor domain-containing protein n=2 Tax=Actinotignum urinale TaxID=190146 RepID=A0AAW9HLB9_9ACTO|nr:LPXTG cell wall anchor domain-containing protein [Actinotignum urinale]MDY5154700.1 LPXTG cell wall anchor domain-containing protein [Actinotignum urinale]